MPDRSSVETTIITSYKPTISLQMWCLVSSCEARPMCGVRASKSAIGTSLQFTSSPSIIYTYTYINILILYKYTYNICVYHLLKALHQGHKVSSLSSLCRSPPIAKQHMEEMSTGHCSDINVATCLGTNYQSQQNIEKHEMVWKIVQLSAMIFCIDQAWHWRSRPRWLAGMERGMWMRNLAASCIILRSTDSGTDKWINSDAQRRATLTNFSMHNIYIYDYMIIYVSYTSGCYMFTFNSRNQM